jgi:SAM-dependent methyltransferase
MASKSADYVLGHADAELARLSTQARVVDPITRRMLVDAGIETGMRVLDVGSGAGDVAWLIAEVVGSGGEVVGCDRAEVAVATARRRAVERGLANVSFLKGDPGTLDFRRPFDAVVGRYVLMFQADPAVLLRGVARAVRRGGLIAFHEPGVARRPVGARSSVVRPLVRLDGRDVHPLRRGPAYGRPSRPGLRRRRPARADDAVGEPRRCGRHSHGPDRPESRSG